MSDFVKSAIDILSRNQKENEQGFVGEIIEVNGLKFKVKKFLAAGGFSNVYVVSNRKGESFAVKRLSGFDKEGCDKILKEIDLHKRLLNDNIVKLHGVSLVQKKVGSLKVADYLLLTELCPLSLVDIINEELTLFTILNIMNQAINSINYLHNFQPSIIHRDIKLENYLISADGVLKLCDFGSATTEVIEPNENWSMKKREELQDEIFSNTSPMYRAPEILNTWENYIINSKVDIWAIGCVFYCILYKRHPFDDAAKLRILNGNYVIPALTKYNCFHTLIKKCLTVNPHSRIDSCEVVRILQHISKENEHKFSEKINLSEIVPQNMDSFNSVNTTELNTKDKTMEVEQKVLDNSDSLQSLINANAFLSSIKGGANTILKNFIGTSSKVLNSMYNNRASHIFNITSRIIVSYQSNTDILKKYLESTYLLSNISIYTFCCNNFRLPPPVRTIQIAPINYNWKIRTPDLEFLYDLIEEMFGFLNSEEKHILVLQENKCCNAAVVVICALFLYSGLVEFIEDALQIFAVRAHPIKLLASEFRYLNYIKKIVKEIIPHHKSFNFVSFSLEKYNHKQYGPTLFVEIYENSNLVYTHDIVNPSNNKEIGVNKNLLGNILIILSIQKNSTKCLETNAKIKLGKIQFHTGFMAGQKLIKFSKEEIDFENDEDIDLSFLIKYALLDEKLPLSKNWDNVRLKKDPKNLFSSLYEYTEVIENFVGTQTCSEDFKDLEKSLNDCNIDQDLQPVLFENITNDDSSEVTKEVNCSDESNEIPILLDLTAHTDDESLNCNIIQNKVPQELVDIFEQSFDNTPINTTQKQQIDRDPFGDLLGFPLSDNNGSNFISKVAQNHQLPKVKKNVPEEKTKIAKENIFLEKNLENVFCTTKVSSESIFLEKDLDNAFNATGLSNVNASSQKTPQKDTDCFADLLGQQGYNFAKKTTSEPKTINDLRKKELLNNMDEDSIKIYQWTQGKRANIRALLCSMHTILWDNASWTKCEMHQLITLVEVKKAYRKACLAVHPDKHIGTNNEKLSKLIFMELNTAWNNFNTENS